MKLGRAIKLCRARKNLTQSALAKRCKISDSYLSLLEAGQRDPTFSTLETIAHGLEIPVSMLVFLAADAAELEVMSSEVKEKISAAIMQLLQATKDDRQPSLI